VHCQLILLGQEVVFGPLTIELQNAGVDLDGLADGLDGLGNVLGAVVEESQRMDEVVLRDRLVSCPDGRLDAGKGGGL
jgi:hypothetical protein